MMEELCRSYAVNFGLAIFAPTIHGLRLHYQLIDLDRFGGSAADLPDLLRAARAMGFGGVVVTLVAPILEGERDEMAALPLPGFVADPDDARPRNVPGARILWWIPGITATPL